MPVKDLRKSGTIIKPHELADFVLLFSCLPGQILNYSTGPFCVCQNHNAKIF